MIPEIGHFALVLALVLAGMLGVFPMMGSLRGLSNWIAMARPAAIMLLAMTAISYACLTWSFVHSDFSVLYVASNSQRALPVIYKVSATWAAHEGSLLLWVLILR